MSSAQTKPSLENTNNSPWLTNPSHGRDFREISVHPNGEELLFVECSREVEPTGGCYVLRYHLGTKKLLRYSLPAEYFYTTASFSPQGKYVLLSRVQKHDASEESVHQAYENSELAWMKLEGTDFKVLPLTKGNKVAPVMSQDETRIAYWRAALRPPGNRTFSIHFDVWEANPLTGEDRLFAGPFMFFERSRLEYSSRDTLIVGAGGPKEHAQDISGYWKKYNRSSVYLISRGTTTLPEPILTEVEGATHPSNDRAGNLYFQGQRPGISLFKKTGQGRIEQWVMPRDLGGFHSLDVAADGSYIAFTYEIRAASSKDAKRGVGLLNTQTSEWKNLAVPSLVSSIPIAVR